MMGQSSFRRELKNYRKSQWIKRGRRPPVVKVHRLAYPFRYETSLKHVLSKLFSIFTFGFYTWFDRNIPRWRKQWNTFYQIVKKDSWEAEVDLFMQSLERDLDVRKKETSVGISYSAYIERIAESVLTFSSGDFAKKLEKLLGQSFYGGTEWWDVVKKEWLKTLESKTKSSYVDFMASIRKYIYNSVKNNVPFDEIMVGVKRIAPQLTEARASFLARDMIGTLHSQIMKNFHLVIGVTDYSWQTQADERVRGKPGGLYPNAIPSHWMMEGIRCRWSEPTVYSEDSGRTWIPRTDMMPKAHPGEPYACRCLPRPMMNPLIDEIDAEIKGELA